MYNQKIYIVNGRPQVVYQQPVYRNPNNYNPYSQPQPNLPPPQPNRSQINNVNAIDGILIQNQYQPEKGDPIVIEEVILKGQVVKVGNKNKQVINQSEGMLSGEGYASQNGSIWKHVPKIVMTVFKIGQLTIKDITKLKARYDSSLPHHKSMKITYANKDFYLAFKEKDFNEWFLRVVWAKLVNDKKQYSQFGNWESQVTGKIYKKSQFLGQWQPRLVIIDSKSLRSSKDNTSSVSLQISSTKQIWTRFQEIKGGYFLVIKLWYGIIKLEFAVPTGFCLKWLYHFLGLLALQ